MTSSIKTPNQIRYSEDMFKDSFYAPDNSGNILFFYPNSACMFYLSHVRDKDGNLISNHSYKNYYKEDEFKLLKSAYSDIRFKFYDKINRFV